MNDNIHILQRPPLDLHVNEKGKLLSNFHNVLVIIKNDEGLRAAIAFDEMMRINLIMNNGRINLDESTGFPRPATDDDYARIHNFVQQSGLRSAALNITREAIDLIAHENSFHPVFDYLETIEWDREQRLSNFFPTCFGTPIDDYHRAIGRMFLISMVARIYRPGCKADYMPIIEGNQGKQKSFACEALAEPWFSDHLPDINSKDASVHLRGKWLVEVAELHRLDKADALQFKSFVTRKEERYRPPYGYAEVIEPRTALFIGTTNKDAYLKDETGNRRFWPVKAVKIRVDYIAQSRDQLFAEAVQAYKRGDKWWPDEAWEDKYAKPQQAARYDGDAWEELIAEFLVKRDPSKPITIIDIAVGALGYTRLPNGEDTPINRFGTADQNRVKRVLASLGWERVGRANSGTLFSKR